MGDWSAGDRGLAAVPGREAQFRASLPRVVEYAQGLDCDVVHIMAGVVGPSTDLAQAEQVYIQNLRYRTFLQPHGVRAVIEPINRRLGVVQGGLLHHRRHARLFPQSQRPGAPHHRARGQREPVPAPGCLPHADARGHLAEMRANVDLLQHVQIAGVPGRHEPDVGEIYPFLFDLLDEIGYADGWAANTARGRAPRPDWAGRGLMGSRHREPECPGARGRGAMRSGLSSHAYAAPGAARRPSTTSWIGGV